MIVSIAAGSVTDVIMRGAAAQLQQRLGQPFIIENQGGASGIVAAQTCKQATPDGYTICVIYHSTMSYNPLLFSNLPYDPDADFVPVTRLFWLTEGVFVPSSLGVNSVAELKALAQSKPNGLNYATLGEGSFPDLFLRWLNNQWNTQIVGIPYKGGGPAAQAIAAGEEQMTRFGVGNFMGLIQAGQAKALAVTTAQRTPLLPDVPTFAEVVFLWLSGPGLVGARGAQGHAARCRRQAQCRIRQAVHRAGVHGFPRQERRGPGDHHAGRLCGFPQGGPQCGRDLDQDRQCQARGLRSGDDEVRREESGPSLVKAASRCHLGHMRIAAVTASWVDEALADPLKRSIEPVEPPAAPAPGGIAAPARARLRAPTPYLAKLNPEQRLAVETLDGPVLVLAGAGTGKTRVLTVRIAHILNLGRARPGEILAVTFTNKAAREMKHRVGEIVGGVVEGMPWLGTFHSIGVKILRRHAELVGLKPDFTILDVDDQVRLLKQILQAEGIDEKRWPARVLAGLIDGWKNRGLTPEQVPAGEAAAFANGKGLKLYKAFQDRLKILNAADFGDLLLECIRLFREHAEVLRQYQTRFKYILVDEYQDTNVAQYLWLRLLAQTHAAQARLPFRERTPNERQRARRVRAVRRRSVARALTRLAALAVLSRNGRGEAPKTSAVSATTINRSMAGAAPRLITFCASSTTSPAPW